MSDMSDPINFPQEDVDVLFEKAKKLWIFLGSTKEDLLSTLTSTEKNRSISETLDFSSYPASVVQRIWNRPKGLSKLLDIKIIDSDPEKGNTIEVGGKRISIYMPEADGKEVFKCPKKFGFQNVRYIKWKAIDSELEKADKKLFDTMVDFDEFIKKNIPWTTWHLKYLNFVELLWLGKSGSRAPGSKWVNMGKFGFVRVTRIMKEVEEKDVINFYKERTCYYAWSIGFSNDIAYSEISWDNELSISVPLLCFEDIESEKK